MTFEELLSELETIQERYTHTAQYVTIELQMDCSGTVYDDLLLHGKHEMAEFDSAADFEDVVRTVKEYYQDRE